MAESYLIKYGDLVRLGEWPITHCVKKLELETINSNTFFISHPWLSRRHPDPIGRKYKVLVQWWHELSKIKEAIESINPEDLTQTDWHSWLRRRFANHQIAKKSSFNDAPWIILGAMTARYRADRREAESFASWLIESIDEVLTGSLWIDTYAIPPKHHRARCSYCAERFHATLRAIPEIISESTCVLLNELVSDDRHRGWILLEAAIASAHDGLILASETSQDWGPTFTFFSIFNLQYECTEFEDATVIARLLGIHQVLPAQNELLRVYPKDLLSRMMEPYYKFALDSPHLSLFDQFRGLLSECLSFDYLKLINILVLGGPEYNGRDILQSMTYLLHGILISECYRQNKRREFESIDPSTYLQACIYFWVCSPIQPLPASYLSLGILYHWQKGVGVQLVDVKWITRLMWMEDILSEEPKIKVLYDLWKAGKEINVYIGQFRPVLP